MAKNITPSKTSKTGASRLDCGLCHDALTGYNEINALFVGKICTTCDGKFSRPKIQPKNALADKASLRKYVRDFESGKANPHNITVKHRLIRSHEDINTIKRSSKKATIRELNTTLDWIPKSKAPITSQPLPLTEAGLLKP